MNDRGHSLLPPVPEALVCARCDYFLDTLPVEGRCPECGLAIDDSIRAAGLWTLVRLRRFRMIVIAFGGAAVSWGIVVVLVAMVPATPALRMIVGSVGLLHTVCLLIAALGGAYAASRQPRRVRIVVSALVSALLVVAAAVVGLGILRVIPLGNAMGPLVLPAAALTRVSVVAVAATWLLLGVRLLGPRWPAQPTFFVTTLGLEVTVWLAALGAVIAAMTSVISLTTAERLVASVCYCDATLLFVMLGLVFPSFAAVRTATGALERG